VTFQSSIVQFFIAGFVYWWVYPKAGVVVYVSPKKLDESIQIELDKDLSFREVNVSISGDKTSSTTGVKTVGEKAKGNVKIQNGTSSPVELSEGIKIVSSSGLGFEISKSASVSAAISPSSPGTGIVEVIASGIGPEYNLAKDEIFKVSNYPKSEVDGISTDNFSGGSSREISAVSEKDSESLKESLVKELDGKAKEQFISQLNESELLIEESMEYEETNVDFSNNVGDEASTLKLGLNLDVKAKIVKKTEITQKALEALSGKIPEGFVLRDDQIFFDFDQDEKDKDLYDVGITVNLLPKIDTDEVAKNITGKYPDLAREYLSSSAGFEEVEFKIKPLFPGKLGTLPHITKKITVELSAKK